MLKTYTDAASCYFINDEKEINKLRHPGLEKSVPVCVFVCFLSVKPSTQQFADHRVAIVIVFCHSVTKSP